MLLNFPPYTGRIITAVFIRGISDYVESICDYLLRLGDQYGKDLFIFRIVTSKKKKNLPLPLSTASVLHRFHPHFPPSHGASSDLDRAPSLRRFLENLSDNPVRT